MLFKAVCVKERPLKPSRWGEKLNSVVDAGFGWIENDNFQLSWEFTIVHIVTGNKTIAKRTLPWWRRDETAAKHFNRKTIKYYFSLAPDVVAFIVRKLPCVMKRIIGEAIFRVKRHFSSSRCRFWSSMDLEGGISKFLAFVRADIWLIIQISVRLKGWMYSGCFCWKITVSWPKSSPTDDKRDEANGLGRER